MLCFFLLFLILSIEILFIQIKNKNVIYYALSLYKTLTDFKMLSLDFVVVFSA
jgi:hypothetical protein